MNEAEFRQLAKERGYGEVTSLDLAPGKTNEMHAHDFSAFVLLLDGDLEIDSDEGTRRFGPGDSCEMSAGTMHCERAGANGASGLVARR